MMQNKNNKEYRQSLGLDYKNSYIKYPNIVAQNTNQFNQYGKSSNLIKNIFLYILKRSQHISSSNILAQEWIEISIEEISKDIDSSERFLTQKTKNCTPSYKPYQSTINDRGTNHKYNAVLSDALYRMYKQPIEFKIKDGEETKRLTILEDLEPIQQDSKTIGFKAKLNKEIFDQIHSQFTLVNLDAYSILLRNYNKHTSLSDLYLYIASKRSLYLSRFKKSINIRFFILCNIVGLKYQEKKEDKSKWRYKEARKSLTRKLNKLVASELLSSFEIERVCNSKENPIDVSLSFTKYNDVESKAITKALKEREDFIIYKYVSDMYKKLLLPANAEQYMQWLANINLHTNEKLKAIENAFKYLYKGKDDASFPLIKKLENMQMQAISWLNENNIPIPEYSLEDKAEKLITVFKKAFKVVFGSDYEEISITSNLKNKIYKIPIDLQSIFTFFKTSEIKRKDIEYYIKNITFIKTRLKNKSNYSGLVMELCKHYIQEMENITDEAKGNLATLKYKSYDSNKKCFHIELDVCFEDFIQDNNKVFEHLYRELEISFYFDFTFNEHSRVPEVVKSLNIGCDL